MYYHAFTPGFNWWYVIGPAILVLSYAIGWMIPHVRRNRDGRLSLKMVFNGRFGKIVAGLFGLAWGVLVFAESYAGVVQYFDNTILTAQDSGVWSLIFAWFAIAVLVAVMCGLCNFAYQIGRNVKKRMLIAKYNLRKRSERPELRLVTTEMDPPTGDRWRDYARM